MITSTRFRCSTRRARLTLTVVFRKVCSIRYRVWHPGTAPPRRAPLPASKRAAQIRGRDVVLLRDDTVPDQGQSTVCRYSLKKKQLSAIYSQSRLYTLQEVVLVETRVFARLSGGWVGF